MVCGRKNQGAAWKMEDEYWKSLVAFYRARVEKVISRIKSHQWYVAPNLSFAMCLAEHRCQQVFRGSFETFVVLSEIAVVLTSLEIRREIESGKPMFEVVGPWKHSFMP
jgi:hypothetical protein